MVKSMTTPKIIFLQAIKIGETILVKDGGAMTWFVSLTFFKSTATTTNTVSELGNRHSSNDWPGSSIQKTIKERRDDGRQGWPRATLTLTCIPPMLGLKRLNTEMRKRSACNSTQGRRWAGAVRGGAWGSPCLATEAGKAREQAFDFITHSQQLHSPHEPENKRRCVSKWRKKLVKTVSGQF